MNDESKRLEKQRTPPVDAQRFCVRCRCFGHYAEECPRKRRRFGLKERSGGGGLDGEDVP